MAKEKKKFFISTAIDYPSRKPHLGHCLERVQADVLARWKRENGFDVHFSIGTDEHGQKIQGYAQRAKQEPQRFVDEISGYFKDLWHLLNISNDDFIRTTERRHQKVVEKVIEKIYDKGDIYKGKYKGLYCVDCETYYLPKDLKNGSCPVHKTPAMLVEEEAYFFKLSKHQQAIIKHIKKHNEFIVPAKRKNEILSRLKEPLQDLSITRKTVDWGIPFPPDKNLTVFVWIDALINYLTTIDYPSEKFEQFWPADVHIVGKDITWHHCVIWPALLLSLGLPLPKTVFVHGYITSGGQKMSKSLGNVVDPFELVKKYGADAVRYFLLREISPTEDGDFTIKKFEERYNADLASGIGNLLARVITLANKIFNFQFSIFKQFLNSNFQTEINRVKKEYRAALDNFKFNEALGEVWQIISFCDKLIEQERPWQGGEKAKEVVGDLLIALQEIANLLKPFLPQTSEKILAQLKNGKSQPLFPRL